jgi:hypothetical protein
LKGIQVVIFEDDERLMLLDHETGPSERFRLRMLAHTLSWHGHFMPEQSSGSQ